MKLLFDLIATQPNKVTNHGGSEYAKVVYKRLLESEGSEKLVGLFDKGKEFHEDVKRLNDQHDVELIGIENKSEIPEVCKKSGIDRFYSALPYNFHDVDLSNTENIFTIHGLRELEILRDRYEFKYCSTSYDYLKVLYKFILPNRYRNLKLKQFEKSINQCKTGKILVPSNHTKYSLLTYFPSLSPDQIHVFYSPLKEMEGSANKNELIDYGIKENDKYFLLVSADRWIKNSYRALKALDELYADHKSLKNYKVIVGGADRNHKLFKELKNKDQFEFIGYVPDIKLQALYANAAALIYPSLNEGFGYPPLEAMAYGTPVLSSPFSAITEICGDSLLYFNPYSVDEIKNRIIWYVNLNKNDFQKSKIKALEKFNDTLNIQKSDAKYLTQYILD